MDDLSSLEGREEEAINEKEMVVKRLTSMGTMTNRNRRYLEKEFYPIFFSF